MDETTGYGSFLSDYDCINVTIADNIYRSICESFFRSMNMFIELSQLAHCMSPQYFETDDHSCVGWGGGLELPIPRSGANPPLFRVWFTVAHNTSKAHNLRWRWVPGTESRIEEVYSMKDVQIIQAALEEIPEWMRFPAFGRIIWNVNVRGAFWMRREHLDLLYNFTHHIHL